MTVIELSNLIRGLFFGMSIAAVGGVRHRLIALQVDTIGLLSASATCGAAATFTLEHCALPIAHQKKPFC
ncbi:hypothetical protein SD70_05410 [Gordoniibacillus kamchatkensis]|uniref:Uncharacterized protein n=1 Tax=Gordoniibacillus kamchatkensis TaxID=1590651 RepID=A0ABR5AMM1_9BACL|nr:hypothetical protein SD70_05410 [Paenibacillus sp. VKM B-2647]